MPFDGNGNWTSEFYPIDDRNNSIRILASKFDTLIQNNLKQSFSNCMTIDSQTKPTTNIDFNNFKGINVADPTLPKDVVNKQTFDNLSKDNLWIGGDTNIREEITVNDLLNKIGLPLGYIKDVITYISDSQISWYGSARDDSNAQDLIVDSASPVTAILTGSPIDSTQHMFIGFDDNDDIKAEFDNNINGDNLIIITGNKRRVFSFVTDSSGDIRPFIATTRRGGNVDIELLSVVRNNPSTRTNAPFSLLDTVCPKDIDTIWKGLIRCETFVSTSGTRTCGVRLDTTKLSTARDDSYRVIVDRLYGKKVDSLRIDNLISVGGQIWYEGININDGGDHYVEQSGYIDERYI